jgi:o-succinylbenzoate---CoA ligase
LLTVTRQQLASSARMTGEILRLGSGTKALVCLNISYIAGLMMLVRGMELGWELTVVEPVSNPLAGFDKNISFDFTAMVPAQLAACLELEDTAEKVVRVSKILLGGAPVGVSLQSRIEKLPVAVYQSYGMTETVSHIALRKLNGVNSGVDYQVLPGIIFGKDDRGCLFISGEMTNGEKIQTNDLVEITSENTFRWLGRADNIINSGGVKIFLDKVDEVVAEVFFKQNRSEHFFCWYQNDERLGQKLILFIEEEGRKWDVPGLISEIRKQVSPYETPKHVYFADRFEKTPTDKIDKRRTAEKFFRLING